MRAVVIVVFVLGSSLRSGGAPAGEQPINANWNLVKRGANASPDRFSLEGDALYGDHRVGSEAPAKLVRFLSAHDKNGDGVRAGSLSQTVSGITAGARRWYRFRIRGLADDGFHVRKDGLYLEVEFFRDGGKNSLDHIKKHIYPQIELEREDLRDKSTNAQLGRGVWRSYELEFRTPFPEVDTLRLTAGFDNGAGRAKQDEFCIAEFTLTQIADPAEFGARTFAARTQSRRGDVQPAEAALVPLGGRWFYAPSSADRTPPARFDHTNADRLYYRTDRFEQPFADNMTAWLRKGYRDRNGGLVKQDRLIADNVTITFIASDLVVHSHNLPNHPTAVFPDRWRSLDGNPNYIQEQDFTWHIPLQPRVDDVHLAMNEANENGALPGGPIGVASNGVVFFNPFDADRVEAIWRLDRCCGHPSPMYEYHYHKYPVCVKSPWSDDGTRHSPLIGFAFDGFPIFGPYEAAGQLAKDSQTNRLNEFNVHQDDARGWHYHVTPGKFPHLIGGYWGVVDARNRPRHPARRPPAGRFARDNF